MNPYKTLELKDLNRIIDSAALDCMMTPALQGKKSDGTVMNITEISAYNNMVAMNNAGVREMAQRLKDILKGGADDE